MAGDYWNAAAAQPARDPGRGKGIAAAALLLVTAGLAVGGSFGAFIVQRTEPGPDGQAITQATSGWGFAITGLDVPADQMGTPPLNGIPLVVGGLVAVVGAIVLLIRRSDARIPAVGRALAALAAGLLVATVAAIWLDLVLAVRAVLSGGGWWVAAEIGTGGWTVLAAALVGVVGAALAAASGSRAGQPAGPPAPPYPPPGAYGPPVQGWPPYPPPAQQGWGWQPGPPRQG